MTAPPPSHPEPFRPEFSRPILVAAIRPGGEDVSLAATEAEAAALARRLGVEGVRELGAELRLTARGRGVVAVTGRVRARLDRLCVVTLEPLEEVIDEPVALLFRPEDGGRGGERARRGGREAEIALSPEAGDEEPYAGGSIDLGEFVAQTLALSLDPWPRAPGAVLPPEVRH